MESPNLTILHEQTLLSVKQTGQYIRQEFGRVSASEVELKALNSLVSYVDKTAEQMLVSDLLKLIPDAGFITEEETISKQSAEWTWIIDPLDGTTNFLQNIPHFSISVALRKGSEIVLGIVLDVMREECFHAIKGGGAHLNNERIYVAKKENLNDCLVVTGFPYSKGERLTKAWDLAFKFLQNSRGLRRFGSAALDLAYVSSGRFDLYYESDLNLWDIAAGILLIREAGGEVTDFEGSTKTSREVVAGNPILQKVALDLIRSN